MKKKREAADQLVRKKSLLYKLKHSPHHKTKKAKWLKAAILSGFVIIVLLAGVQAYLLHRLTQLPTDKKAQKAAAQLVVGTGVTAQYHTLTSTLGFTIQYDAKAFKTTAQVTDPKSTSSYVYGQEYDGKDLDKARDYSLVKFHLPDQKNGSYSFAAPQLTVITNIRKDYFTNLEAQAANAGKSDLDILVSKTTGAQAAAGYTASQPTDVAIHGVSYKEVIYTLTDDSYGITTVSTQTDYFTVQNGRPYTLEITGINKSNSADVPLFQAVIKTIEYTSLDTTKLSANNGTATAAKLPAGTSNVPHPLDPATILNVVAKNQPSVVRVGTLSCADITLSLPDGSVGMQLLNACAGGIGSGSFVSSDGYVATNGHVVQFTTADKITGYLGFTSSDKEASQRIKGLLQYLVKSNIMTRTDEESLITAAQNNDQTAIDKLNNIGSLIPDASVHVQHLTSSFVLQTSNDPLRYKVDTKGVAWVYNKTNIAATYVDSDIDPTALLTGMQPADDSTHSDVAILKAKGSFPVVTLGSISGLQEGDELTAIGYPAFVDGGTETKLAHTVPSVTQGNIQSTQQQTTHTLIITTVPIAEGNSGGPAFNSVGKEIGLNTYGIQGCSDNQCFGDGIIRDISDYQALVAKNHITLTTSSTISSEWNSGVDAVSRGDYQTAAAKFKVVQSAYPANYLAPQFLALAEQRSVSTSVASDTHSAIASVKIGAVATAGAVVIGGVWLILHLLKGHRLAEQGLLPVVPVPNGMQVQAVPAFVPQPQAVVNPVSQMVTPSVETPTPPGSPPNPPPAAPTA